MGTRLGPPLPPPPLLVEGLKRSLGCCPPVLEKHQGGALCDSQIPLKSR